MNRYICIKVKNQTESEYVQRILFRIGYEWPVFGKHVKYTSERFLYMTLDTNRLCKSVDYDSIGVIVDLNFEEFITKLENEL